MSKKMMKKGGLTLLLLFLLAHTVVAQNTIKKVVCNVITYILQGIQPIGASFVALMFVYGGLVYVYSADNPGGRKKGRDICVHAIIGGIIVVLADGAAAWVGITGSCP